MRHLIFAAASAACLLAGFATTSPAAADQSRYCLQGRIWGYPGNCQFSTYQQCQASASGTDAGCGINSGGIAGGSEWVGRIRLLSAISISILQNWVPSRSIRIF